MACSWSEVYSKKDIFLCKANFVKTSMFKTTLLKFDILTNEEVSAIFDKLKNDLSLFEQIEIIRLLSE